MSAYLFPLAKSMLALLDTLANSSFSRSPPYMDDVQRKSSTLGKLMGKVSLGPCSLSHLSASSRTTTRSLN
ncbi:hypothetical protein L596_003069 [Steinernema carpocapsae]|uniref:Secreted protein n=1 Tax=Steinernema carpocapsae TaxID=34508 RepID=A0A4U8UVA0_STECR|nr:hypothetical protein L596_003069 [Steinernema carpocapsae]